MKQVSDNRRNRYLILVLCTVPVVMMLVLSMVTAVSANSGDISGAITYVGGADPEDWDHFNVDLQDMDFNPISGTNIDGPGNYVLEDVDDGQYYVCVSITPFGQSYQCYDDDNDGVWDPVQVAGANVSDIDIIVGGPWMPTNGPFAEGGQVKGLAVHPAVTDKVFAAVSEFEAYDNGPSTIYASEDGAENWNSVYTSSNIIYALETAGTNVYAGAFNPGGEGETIYVSNDSGENWAPAFTFPDRGVLLSLSIDANDSSVAIAGGWMAQEDAPDKAVIFKTKDAGKNWEQIFEAQDKDSDATVLEVMIHPNTPALMFATHTTYGAESYLMKSANGGKTWEDLYTFSDAHVISLAASTSKPKTLFAGAGFSQFSQGRAAIFRSEDTGVTWKEVYDEGTYLAFAPPNTVYSIMDTGEFAVSTSNGDPGSWEMRTHDAWPWDFEIDLGNSPPSLYIGTREDGIRKSEDDGNDFNPFNSDIVTRLPIVDIAPDPEDPGKIFAAAECAGAFSTSDGGDNWEQFDEVCTGAFAINPENPDIVYMGEYNCGRGALRRSDDGGDSFSTIYTPPFIEEDCSGGEEQIRSIAIAASDPDVVYAAGIDRPTRDWERGIILRTLDDGDTVEEVLALEPGTSIVAVVINPRNPDIIFAGGSDCSEEECVATIHRSTDGGEKWNLVYSGESQRVVRTITIDFAKPMVVYAGLDNYDLVKSTDGGNNWKRIRECCPSGDRLVVDPNLSGHVYLGGWGYIAESLNGGIDFSEWEHFINDGTLGMQPDSLVLRNGDEAQTLFAGFSGVWTYNRTPLGVGERYVFLPAVLRK